MINQSQHLQINQVEETDSNYEKGKACIGKLLGLVISGLVLSSSERASAVEKPEKPSSAGSTLKAENYSLLAPPSSPWDAKNYSSYTEVEPSGGSISSGLKYFEISDRDWSNFRASGNLGEATRSSFLQDLQNIKFDNPFESQWSNISGLGELKYRDEQEMPFAERFSSKMPPTTGEHRGAFYYGLSSGIGFEFGASLEYGGFGGQYGIPTEEVASAYPEFAYGQEVGRAYFGSVLRAQKCELPLATESLEKNTDLSDADKWKLQTQMYDIESWDRCVKWATSTGEFDGKGFLDTRLNTANENFIRNRAKEVREELEWRE